MKGLHLSRQWCELAVVLLLMLITMPLFWLTNLDERVSAWFFDGNTWQGLQWTWSRWLFAFAPKIVVWLAVGALVLVLLSYSNPQLKPYRRKAGYFVLLVLLGAGLLVNLVFKDNWGRPRPVHLSHFSGQYAYVPPLKLANTPDKSFSCGHCAAVFSAFALYFLARRHKGLYLSLALILGVIMSAARLASGGHFLSDALWSAYVMFLTAWLLYYAWYIRAEPVIQYNQAEN
jgi:membrane-associated PAP2 superfamily phosphatase